MIVFLPLNTKGFIMQGPIWNAFIHAAAMLLCVPAQYMRILIQLRLDIERDSQLQHYDTLWFGNENHTGTSEVARYLASIGMTAEQAEQWRAWATAYINMELKTHPNLSHAMQLQEAQAQANECIDQDHTLVLQNISQSSPRYYYPGSCAP